LAAFALTLFIYAAFWFDFEVVTLFFVLEVGPSVGGAAKVILALVYNIWDIG
jgi:hypothetical protein